MEAMEEISIPDFSSQTTSTVTRGIPQWITTTSNDFLARGAKELRASVDDPRNPTAFLMEGWLSRPSNPPPPCFHMVEGDTDGDSDADFQIKLEGVSSAPESHFLL